MNRPQQPPIPDHRLFGLIASGAYGEVWLGSNALGTLRAVKIVRRDQHLSLESFEREFKGLQKFEPVSRSHEGLVDILTLGLLTDGSGFYYVMELADDIAAPTGTTAEPCSRVASSPSETYRPRTLRADLKSRGALPAEEVIRLGLKLTAALSHLHGQGLVHRDVKPSNILFVGGEPKLADAGLVAAMDDARSLVGTAGYIAPEGPGTPQADLYALGKVLYEAAFGKDRQEFPALPADVAARPDHRQLLELNEIIATACAHDPKHRYSGAKLMGAELALLGEGRSVKRRRAYSSSWKVAWKIALPICAIVTVSASSHWLWMRHSSRSPTERVASSFGWSTNEAAREEFLKGVRSLQADGNNYRAIHHFESAIQKDPNFAEAHARLAWACYSSGDEKLAAKGVAAAEKAVLLDGNLAYAHSMLATARFTALSWAEAEKERALAVALMNPNSPSAQEILLESALNLACCGKTNEALQDLKRARSANPDSASNKREVFYGFVYAWCRQYERAFEIWRQFPRDDSYFMYKQHAQAYLATGNFTNFMRFRKQAALAAAENAQQVNAEFEALDKAFQHGTEQKFWEQSLEFESSKRDSDHLMRMAEIHARLNQPREAFRYLKQAMQEMPTWFSEGIYTNPSFDSLRNEREFQEIIDKLWRKK